MAEIVQEPHVRIRGTFVELFKRKDSKESQTRSRSAPPGHSDPFPVVLAQNQYISSLTRRAACLSQKCLDANSVTSTKRPSDANSETSTRRPSDTASATPNLGLENDPFDQTMPSQNETSSPSAKSNSGDYGKYKRINLTRTGRADAALKWLETNCAEPGCPYEDPDTSEITTLMICDIPCRRSIEQILGAIDGVGFSNTYNLVYVPYKRPKKGCSQNVNMGYAFVNFITPEKATSFTRTFQNFAFPGSVSKKLSYAKAARSQGYQVNLERLLTDCTVTGCLLVSDEEAQVD
jgi:hypothetical protein